MHIAADNYFFPAVMGVAAPAETGITKEYPTAAAFEKKVLGREALIAELQKSFDFLRTHDDCGTGGEDGRARHHVRPEDDEPRRLDDGGRVTCTSISVS